MARDFEQPSLLQMLRSDQPHRLIRTGVSVAAAALLQGVCMLAVAAVLLATAEFDGGAALVLSVFLASILWFFTLGRIWRIGRAEPTLLAPVLRTLAMVGALWAVCGAAANLIRYDEEYVIAALLLCGSSGVIFIWLNQFARIMNGKALIGPDRQIAVHCPECGYSLIGLQNLRCPECGARFTVDELVRTQRYGAVRSTCGTAPIANLEPKNDAPAVRAATLLTGSRPEVAERTPGIGG